MKSMTGFGSSEYKDENIEISIEIKTVNHRYKDFNIRLPRNYVSFEESVRNIISKEVSRGRVDVFVKIENTSSSSDNISYNKDLARNYYDTLKMVGEDFEDLEDNIKLSTIIRYPEVITTKQAERNLEEDLKVFTTVLQEATISLKESREKEGVSLKADFIKRIEIIKSLVVKVEEFAHLLPEKYNEQLLSNLEKYNLGNIDENRILTELALYAEKVNITEEIVRFNSHLDNFMNIIDLKEPVGRKLDFLLQEINREINTMASKSNNYEINSICVDVKSELEKIREQVQNIE